MHTLDAAFDFLSPARNGSLGGSASAAPVIMGLEWNRLPLYRPGYASKVIRTERSVEI
jgi:hypothetical protein